jgi:hypothetical protein
MAGRQPGAEKHQDVIPALSYSMSGAAARTNIPATKLWAASKAEQLRTFRVGRSRRVSEAALCAFIEALETKAIVIDNT